MHYQLHAQTCEIWRYQKASLVDILILLSTSVIRMSNATGLLMLISLLILVGLLALLVLVKVDLSAHQKVCSVLETIPALKNLWSLASCTNISLGNPDQSTGGVGGVVLNPAGATAASCSALQSQYGVIPLVSFGTAPQAARVSWTQNGCDTYNHPDFQLQVCDTMESKYQVVKGISWGSAPAGAQSLWGSFGCDKKILDCVSLADKYGIEPGKSWGTAPSDVKTRWAALSCDAQVATRADTCHSLASQYGIIPNLTWGSAENSDQTKLQWTTLHCDALLYSQTQSQEGSCAGDALTTCGATVLTQPCTQGSLESQCCSSCSVQGHYTIGTQPLVFLLDSPYFLIAALDPKYKPLGSIIGAIFNICANSVADENIKSMVKQNKPLWLIGTSARDFLDFTKVIDPNALYPDGRTLLDLPAFSVPPPVAAFMYTELVQCNSTDFRPYEDVVFHEFTHCLHHLGMSKTQVSTINGLWLKYKVPNGNYATDKYAFMNDTEFLACCTQVHIGLTTRTDTHPTHNELVQFMPEMYSFLQQLFPNPDQIKSQVCAVLSCYDFCYYGFH